MAQELKRKNSNPKNFFKGIYEKDARIRTWFS